MFYYTNDGRKIKYTSKDEDYIGVGLNSCVYHYDDKCIKIYHENIKSIYKIQGKIFELLKKLNLDNFCKLHELLFDEQKYILAYTMNYYMTCEENISRLYNSLMILSKKKGSCL